MEENATAVQNATVNTDYSNKSLNEILTLFREMLDRGDQMELYKNAEVIKASFYKVLRNERKDQVVSEVYVDSSNPNQEVETNPFEAVEKAFKDLYAEYKVIRNNYTKELQIQKEDNLRQKQEIIDGINQLLDDTADVNVTFPRFKALMTKWKSIGSVPIDKAKELWDNYNHTVEKFYDYVKLNNDFRDLDFRKNLEAKNELCEKAEALVKEKDVVKAFMELQRLHDEWKDLGPVAKSERENIWNRFKSATSVINKKHQEYFENLKENQKNNLVAKTELCEKAEAIAASQSDDSNSWNSLSKQLEELQAKWRTIGYASKKENQKIYERFRAACDKFYSAKREYYARFKDVMEENLKKKEDLCIQAEQLKDSTDWKNATDKFINLQRVWRQVGPVARKHSDAVWKRFRAACDEFFDNKAKHYNNEGQGFEENLEAKRALIEEIKNYVVTNKEDNPAALEDFLKRWNSIGFVPYSEKENIEKEFDAALNLHFEDIRNKKEEKKMVRIARLIADAKSSGKGERGIRTEREKLLNKFRKLESDISTLENNMGFFAKSKNADKIIEDIKKKIESGKEELKQLEQKIKMIDKEF